MTQPPSAPRDDTSDITRVTQEIAGRLRAKGVAAADSDSPDEVVRMLEAVEAFEQAVEARGGDLMMDEPPKAGSAQPDHPHFVLPSRTSNESAADYTQRLIAATAVVRQQPTRP